MNILVLGRSGQLATSLRRLGHERSDLSLQFAGRDELDLSQPGLARARILADHPELVINAAAYTAVDKAETEPEAAMRLNADAPAEAAAAAHEVGAGFIHVSTDYVFDGTGERPWREDDRLDPQNVYGRTKAAGEWQVRAAHPGAIILRTAWVYGQTPPNFVNTMLRLAATRPELKVVDDQYGCPTHSDDLARVILALAQRGEEAAGETLHVAGSEVTSWARFARGIFAASAAQGGPSAAVVPCTSDEFAAPAPRPRNSRLSGERLEKRLGLTVPGWSRRIDETVAGLLAVISEEGRVAPS
ncbi:dTDP-4-dehydrorhamnose reductase [Sphingomonas humi]|uniref:dTDP-4-dehydrorhamnose reductase n=1 Tax=Sphingomonas humi TaxID=335630 RepID=A0ABP7SDK6_9SPHN